MKENNLLTWKELIIFISCSSLFVTFLFFIDEGYYTFESFTKIENTIPFLLYMAVSLVGQLLLAKVLSLFTKEQWRVWASAFIGPVISVCMLIAVLPAFK